MENQKDKKKKKTRWLLLLLFLILVLAVALFIFLNGNKDKKNAAATASPGATPTASPAPYVPITYENDEDAYTDFFTASTLHLKGRLESIDEDGAVQDAQAMEIWKTADALRVDYDIDGSHYRTLLVKNGTAIFYYHGSQTKNTAVVPADVYLEAFVQKTLIQAVNMGQDEVFDGTKYAVAMKKTFDVEGASNKYYIDSVLYCAGKNGILYIQTVGNTLDDSYQIPTAFYTSTEIFEEYALNVTIDPSVFDAPF